jgi:S-(hydroxymethyl)glutathione dehydrogenase/alcohol dehydrogenase
MTATYTESRPLEPVLELARRKLDLRRRGGARSRRSITDVAGRGATLEVMPRDPIAGWTILDARSAGQGRDQVPQLIDRYLAGEIDVDAFISHRIGLDEVNRGSELMHHQDGSGPVIEFG